MNDDHFAHAPPPAPELPHAPAPPPALELPPAHMPPPAPAPAGSGWSTGPPEPGIVGGMRPLAAPARPRLPLALGLGAAAGLAGALVWYAVVVTTNLQVGLAAVVIGALVGKAVGIGAGPAASRALRPAAIGLTVLTMAAAEYLVIRHFVHALLAEEGLEGALPLVPDPVLGAQLVGSMLIEDPLTLVFWAIAIFAAWRLAVPSEG